jgi:hypothetical protein
MAGDLWCDIDPGSRGAQSLTQSTVSGTSEGRDRLGPDCALQRKLLFD